MQIFDWWWGQLCKNTFQDIKKKKGFMIISKLEVVPSLSPLIHIMVHSYSESETKVLLALMLKVFTSVPMSLEALHWALMSEVTLTDTTLWIMCSFALLTTSCQSCGDTHKHTLLIRINMHMSTCCWQNEAHGTKHTPTTLQVSTSKTVNTMISWLVEEAPHLLSCKIALQSFL